jgi:hypothetical protein
MRGDARTVAARVEELRGLRNWVAQPAPDFMELVVGVAATLWSSDLDAALAPFAAVMAEVPEDLLGRDFLFLALARAGRVEQLRRLSDRPVPHVRETWGTTQTAACIAEAAAALGDEREAARARALLAPASGRMAVSGISVVLGPVDGYLALAEATLGRTQDAAASADRALTLARAWGLGEYERWLDDWRARLGF